MSKKYIFYLCFIFCVSGHAFSQVVKENGDNGLASSAILENPSGIAIDRDNNIYIGERRANRIRKIDAKTGIIKTLAGTGNRAFSGDGGPADKADISIPETIIIDHNNDLIFCDRGNSRVRKVNLTTGIISTVAGTGIAGYSGDGGLATKATISYPYGLAVDKDENLYIADTDNHCIRKVERKTGIITTVAGNGRQGYSGDNGQAKDASFYRPHVITFDSDGNLVIGDSFNQRLRKINRTTGIITTMAGTGEQASKGDGGPALSAAFIFFGALVSDKDGNIFMTGGDNRIRKIDASSKIINTIAGTGESGNNGLNIDALKCKLAGPYGMTMDGFNNIYFVDTGNARVLKLDAFSNIISLIAGGKKKN